MLSSAWLAESAHADGDPASDVLATQALFLPQDAGVPANQQAQLAALVAAAGRQGYRIRVALIASAADLGSITELWNQPETYSRFLGQELALVYRGPLLVVMPDGFGLYGVGGAHVPAPATIAAAHGATLGSTTIAAIQLLARAAGHPVSVPVAVSASPSRSADVVPWLVFAIGLALIAAAWTASVRARPLWGEGRAPQ